MVPQSGLRNPRPCLQLALSSAELCREKWNSNVFKRGTQLTFNSGEARILRKALDQQLGHDPNFS
jgi:hypothetical protein